MANFGFRATPCAVRLVQRGRCAAQGGGADSGRALRRGAAGGLPRVPTPQSAGSGSITLRGSTETVVEFFGFAPRPPCALDARPLVASRLPVRALCVARKPERQFPPRAPLHGVLSMSVARPTTRPPEETRCERHGAAVVRPGDWPRQSPFRSSGSDACLLRACGPRSAQGAPMALCWVCLWVRFGPSL